MNIEETQSFLTVIRAVMKIGSCGWVGNNKQGGREDFSKEVADRDLNYEKQQK